MIDLEKMDYVASIPAGGVPRPYVITRDGRTMYVAVSDLHGFIIVDIPEKKVVSNSGSDDVSIIDAKARREVARLKVGRVPKRLVAASVTGGDPAKQSATR
jgi:YVTN family beta-propeller protein